MKKVAYLLLLTFSMGVLFSSCAHKPCSAYGETKKYQIEKPFRN